MQMSIETWMITLGFIALTAGANYIAFKTGVGKDIINLFKKSDKNSDRLDCVEKEIAECVKKDDCKEDRKAYEKSQDEIKATVIRLEQKFDRYILNGRGNDN